MFFIVFYFFFFFFLYLFFLFFFFFSSIRRHTRYIGDWSSDVCSSDLNTNDQDTECHRGGCATLQREAATRAPLQTHWEDRSGDGLDPHSVVDERQLPRGTIPA